MVLPTTGQLGIGAIRTEFNSSRGDLGAYYRGGSVVLDNLDTASIPTSGSLAISQFRGARHVWVFTYTLNAGAFANNLNVYDAAVAAGYPGGANRAPLIATINIRGTLGSVDGSLPAFRIGTSWASSYAITLNVFGTGIITGAGASIYGATFNRNGYGGTGGDAVWLEGPCTINNSGIIQGGGGSGSPGHDGQHGAGCGYFVGTGIAGAPFTGSPNGTTRQGGFAQNCNHKKGRPNGGMGGGWVTRTQVISGTTVTNNRTDGWGTDGGQVTRYGQPGRSIAGTNAASGTLGSLFGPTAPSWNTVFPIPPAGTLISTYCVPGDPAYTEMGVYSDGAGGTYQQVYAYYSSNCGYYDPGGTTCFPSGSMVLMWDGSEKAIEDIVESDLLMGADGQQARIKKIDRPRLGTNRRMLAFEEDTTMRWSDEHSFWVKKQDQQWWWTYNHKNWIREVESGDISGLKDNYSHIIDHDVEFANLEGFAKRTVVDVTDEYSTGADTQLYLPVTESGVPIIVNRYVVAASLDEFAYDYTKFDWSVSLEEVKSKIK